MSTTTPALLEQRMSALKRANKVRLARAALLHRMFLMPMAESHLFAADVLEDLPDVLSSLQVGHFLDRLRKKEGQVLTRERPVSRASHSAHAQKLLAAARLQSDKRLGELTPGQRAVLAAVLRLVAESRVRNVVVAGGPLCKVCGEQLQRSTATMTCGFCQESLKR